ncbi:class I SAM-dependent methyltransferase [Microvirga pudoricolor]|uniref:class I SAM-dependent methyltransferase n=1 Tax=Microvirga pudoricolor TaxID=2778729 RepID=UPI00194E9169|nr:methyltransferase domain-containing protein [Microvirga pudoricolor]MBM6595834.1 methyltransferase domain-containing protein [Microvirga pudoricolor]
MPRFLHVGCGPKRKDRTVEAFASPQWEEVTLDIDESVAPDIVDKLPELAHVVPGSFDAVYSAHNIEHLYPHEVPQALAAFHRVLKNDGIAVITCPDLQSIGERLATGDIDLPLYESPRGPVAPLDMLYGFRPAMREGNLYMAHHTGFTLASLRRACDGVGFSGFVGFRRPDRHDLWAMVAKGSRSKDELRDLGMRLLRPL